IGRQVQKVRTRGVSRHWPERKIPARTGSDCQGGFLFVAEKVVVALLAAFAKRTRTGIFFFLQGSAELLESDVLQLADPLAGHAEFLADFFESFRLLPGEAKAGVDDLAFALVENLKEVVELHVHV